MNKVFCVCLIALLGLSFSVSDSHAEGLKPRNSAKAEDSYNPTPAADDLTLPMPGGQQMVFKAIGVRGKGLLWDLETGFGCQNGDDERALYERRYNGAISGPFLFSDMPADWQKRVRAASPDAREMQYYFIGKYEVTQKQWDAVMNGSAENTEMQQPEDARPVVQISWYDALLFTQRYTEWLLANAPDALPVFMQDSKNTAFVRLPSAEEWEYAAKGGHNASLLTLRQEDFHALPEGETIASYAVFRHGGAAEENLQRIGSRKPNPAGVYDMSGNAAEMVQDSFRFSIGGRLHGSSGGFIRKGGSYLSSLEEIMPGRREELAPFLKDGANRMRDLGFRVALSGINTPAGARPGQLATEWHKAGVELSASLNPSGDPLELVDQLAKRAQSQEEKNSLQSIQQLIKENNIALERQKRLSLEGEIRSAAYLVTMLKDCLIKREIIRKEQGILSQKRVQSQELLKKAPAPQAKELKMLIGKLDATLDAAQKGILSQNAEFRSMLLFYKQSLENTQKQPRVLFDEQMELVSREMAGDAPHLAKQKASLALYKKHVDALRKGKLQQLSADALNADIMGMIGAGK